MQINSLKKKEYKLTCGVLGGVIVNASSSVIEVSFVIKKWEKKLYRILMKAFKLFKRIAMDLNH